VNIYFDVLMNFSQAQNDSFFGDLKFLKTSLSISPKTRVYVDSE